MTKLDVLILFEPGLEQRLLELTESIASFSNIHFINHDKKLGSGYSILRGLQLTPGLGDNVIVINPSELLAAKVEVIKFLPALIYASNTPSETIRLPVEWNQETMLKIESLGPYVSSINHLEAFAPGFSPVGLFQSNKKVLIDALTQVECSLLKEGTFITNGVFDFYNVFHYLWNQGNPAEAFLTKSVKLEE